MAAALLDKKVEYMYIPQRKTFEDRIGGMVHYRVVLHDKPDGLDFIQT